MKRLIITEDERKHIMGLYEQFTLLNIQPQNIIFNSGDNTKQIKLTGVDPKTNQSLELKYNVKAKFGFSIFDVNIKNISRNSAGYLFAQVQPASDFGKQALKLIPDKFKSSDGWLYIRVDNNRIVEAIKQLIQNKGYKANLNAGHGVTIQLTLANT
jgi:hypothetical protein